MDVTSKQKNKIVKYIIDDRPKKLTKYIQKEDIKLDAIINKKGEKMLHICAREGSADCLQLLVEKGCKVNLVDAGGNLPIHLALQYCIEHFSRDIEQNLVSYLLTYSSNHLQRQNFEGVSAKDLLNQLNQMKGAAADSSDQSPVRISSDEQDSDDQAYSDAKWRQKLQDECDQEFQANLGRYEDVEEYWGGGGGGRESYDAWADRIYQAFSARQRRAYASSYTQASSKKQDQPQKEHKKKKNLRVDSSDSTNSKQATDKLREMRKRAKVLEMYKKLFESQEEISAEDIPFNNLKPPEIIDIMLQGKTGETDLKKTIREELRRWHPDKFKQKLGERIKKEEVGLVMTKVKAIAQALTSFAR